MKLSIIIPAYNVEKYIENCLISTQKQDIEQDTYEVIVIVDGSKDKTLKIAENVSKNYKNISVIYQENEGLSGARNKGFNLAKGKYVWFVDSDDYIEENSLGRIVSYLKDDLDILQLQFRHVYEDDTPPLDIEFCRIIGIKNGQQVTEQGGLPAPAQFSIYRTQFLKENNLMFVKGIYHEDSEFKPRATYLARKIASDTCISYNYLQRTSGSITSKFKLKNGLDIFKVINSLLIFAHQINMPQKYRKHLYRQIGMNMNSLLMGIRQLSREERLLIINEINKNIHIFDCMIQSGIFKYQIEGIIFKINVSLGLFLHHYIR